MLSQTLHVGRTRLTELLKLSEVFIKPRKKREKKEYRFTRTKNGVEKVMAGFNKSFELVE
jgi:hypothetical protein